MLRLTTILIGILCSGIAAGPALGQTTPPPEALIGEIPFHPATPASRVMIDLAAPGSPPFVLMLDTGASASVLTPRTARSLGVSIRRGKSSEYRRKTRLGRDLLFWVDTSSSDTGGGGGGEFGLLGADFLDDYVLEIDYPGRFVRFYDPKKYRVPEEVDAPDEAVIDFRRSGARILVDLEVEGTPLVTLLDTGAPAVLLSGPLARKAGISLDGLPELEGVSGVLGPIETYTYEAERVRLAEFSFGRQPIAIAPRGGYNQGGPTDSALGYDILGHFVMRIDYPRKRLWLRRGPQKPPSYWGRREGPRFEGPALRVPSAEAIAEREAKTREQFHKQKVKRLYAETSPGRFVVVEGYRLRDGPKEGEVWYSHEEMLARKKELEASTQVR